MKKISEEIREYDEWLNKKYTEREEARACFQNETKEK